MLALSAPAVVLLSLLPVSSGGVAHHYRIPAQPGTPSTLAKVKDLEKPWRSVMVMLPMEMYLGIAPAAMVDRKIQLSWAACASAAL